MQCYTELVAPSGVTHAIYTSFTSATASNLIVARTSLLQIFSLKQLNGGQEAKLVMVAEYNLSGTITAMAPVKTMTSRSGGDAVLVAFRDAKLSLVEWNPEQYNIATISIHYYEGDDLHSCPWDPAARDCVSRLTVDPGSRCAAFHFGSSKLALLPFHQLGDDLVMDDYDSLDGEEPEKSGDHTPNGDMIPHSTPYDPSFVWPITNLDPTILHPIDFAFLYEYRQPTIGILYSTAARSPALQFERQDTTAFAAFTVDLDQKTSIRLLTVPKLPNDVFKVAPLAPPVGGVLLIGGNEVIHVDQGGKTHAIGVNEFAKPFSSFSLTDQSHYRLRLEGCQVEQLTNSTGDVLIILTTGELAILSFRLDGRSVSGISIRRIPDGDQKSPLSGRVSCVTCLTPGRIFVGSEESDSLLLGAARSPAQLKRHGSRLTLDQNKTENGGFAESDGEEDEDDDDLYAESAPRLTGAGSSETPSLTGTNFRILDRLPSISTIKDVAFGRPPKRRRLLNSGDAEVDDGSRLDLVVASGSGQAGGVTILNRNIRPTIIKISERESVCGLWPITARRKRAGPTDNVSDDFHEYIILSKEVGDGREETNLYSISNGDLVEKSGTEFDASAGRTIEIGSIRSGSHTVQVLESEVRVYDAEFGLAQIWPFGDEEDGMDAKAARASFADPFVLIMKDDSSLLLLKADKNGELDEIDLPDPLSGPKFISASLFHDSSDTFDTRRYYDTSATESLGHLLAVLGDDGSLGLYSLPHLSIQVFYCENVHFLTTILAKDNPIPKHWKNKETLTEIILADIGDRSDRNTYLIIKTSSDDIALYQPYPAPGSVGSFQFRKICSRRIASALVEADVDDKAPKRHAAPPMRVLPSAGDFSCVFIPGAPAALVLKNAFSIPHVHDLSEPSIRALNGFHTAECPRGFAYVDSSNNLRMAQLPVGADFSHSEWVSKEVKLGLDVTHLTYLDRTASYILTTTTLTEFQLPQDDEWHPEWRDESVTFSPQVARGSIRLFSGETWKELGSFRLEPAERALCIKTLNLEVSEETHERKDLVVVGTAITKGENISVRGCIYLFDVVGVVPEPGVPETNLQLKLVAKEEVKGAVSAVSHIGSQGFLLTAQGQKCMVRGLKEDLSILPVAFMDMKYYVGVAKELKGTGLCILGDAMSGLWFVGYSEEPYKLQLFSRDQLGLEVVTAEFLPDGKQLFIIAADGDGKFHVLQFDPENPKSQQGTKLLHRHTFYSGAFPTTMTMLPRTHVSSEISHAHSPDEMDVDDGSASRQILVTTQEGGLGLITPLSEQAYRRLSSLQNILIANLEHPCGLNPRAYRAVETDGIGGRGMIDGSLVQKWLDQSSQHKASTADRAGGTVWDVRGDLEAIGGAGLGFL